MRILKITILIVLFLALTAGAVLLSRRYLNQGEPSAKGSWLCQNGQWVKQGNPVEPMPSSGCGDQGTAAEVMLDSPRSDQTVSSPLTIEGRARGSWFFEASFPVELVDSQNNRLGISFVQAQSDWMTADFVPFLGRLDYQAAATTSGRLILMNDNPSGLPENQKQFSIPVIISPSQTIAVKAFFSNNNLDPEITCTKVFAVERRVPKTTAVARAALEQLLAGPTAEEKSQGYSTSINPGVKIQKLEIVNGVAKVDFDQTLEQAVGGSCRVSAIRAQIVQTLKQFSTVKDTVISINGRIEDILQP